MSLSVHTGCARRTRCSRARVRIQIRRDEAADDRTEIGSRASQRFPEGTPPLRIRIPLPRHRALHAGAVLSLVNALRFASTRPAAGPSGIDDACARHDLGYCAMAGFLIARAGREKRVDAGFPQAYVDVSRLCPNGTSSASHPVHAERVSVVAPRARFKRPPTTSRQAVTASHGA